MWKTALDAVVTLLGMNTFSTLLRIAGTFGVLAALLPLSNNVTRW
jgi:conjugal transfer mating pair stabilization protein TraG